MRIYPAIAVVSLIVSLILTTSGRADTSVDCDLIWKMVTRKVISELAFYEALASLIKPVDIDDGDVEDALKRQQVAQSINDAFKGVAENHDAKGDGAAILALHRICPKPK